MPPCSARVLRHTASAPLLHAIPPSLAVPCCLLDFAQVPVDEALKRTLKHFAHLHASKQKKG